MSPLKFETNNIQLYAGFIEMHKILFTYASFRNGSTVFVCLLVVVVPNVVIRRRKLLFSDGNGPRRRVLAASSQSISLLLLTYKLTMHV